MTQSSTHNLLISFISCASFVPNSCSDCFSSSQNQLHYQHRPTPARLWIVCSLLFVILLMICKFLPQLLYFQCWYILWNISGANTSDHCFQLRDIHSVFFKHSKKSFVRTKKKQEIVLAIVRIVGVMVLFGLTWILGAFTIKGASLLFQWFFVICNTLQGVFIFLLFVVVNKNVQTEFKSFVSSHSGSLKLHSQGSKSYSVDTGTLKSLKSDRPSVFLTDKKKAVESTVSSKAIEISMEMETFSDEPNSPSVVFDEKESTENTKAAETSVETEALSDEPSLVLTDVKESTVNAKATAVSIEMDTSVQLCQMN